jgi:hypothetical protein
VLLEPGLERRYAGLAPLVGLLEGRPGRLGGQELNTLTVGVVKTLGFSFDRSGLELDLVGGVVLLLASAAGQATPSAHALLFGLPVG